MITGTHFEDYEICTGEHCHQREECARWMYNVDVDSPDLKNCYINFHKKRWKNYLCPFFLKYPNPDYPQARPDQYSQIPPTPLQPSDLPPYKRSR